MRDGDRAVQENVIAAAGETNHLPLVGEILGQIRERNVLDEDTVEPLVEPVREVKLFATPNRPEPGFGDEEKDYLAAVCDFFELALPALACGDPALWTEIKKNLVLPSLTLQPFEQDDGSVVVGAGMADEDARFSAALQHRSSLNVMPVRLSLAPGEFN